MKVFFGLVFQISFLLYSNITLANDLDARDWALNICLKNNYSKIVAFETKDIKDYSSFNTNWSPEQDLELIHFVKMKTGDFYKENLSIKSEVNPPPYNAIFQRCMEFYKSKELKTFILKNK